MWDTSSTLRGIYGRGTEIGTRTWKFRLNLERPTEKLNIHIWFLRRLFFIAIINLSSPSSSNKTLPVFKSSSSRFQAVLKQSSSGVQAVFNQCHQFVFRQELHYITYVVLFPYLNQSEELWELKHLWICGWNLTFKQICKTMGLSVNEQALMGHGSDFSLELALFQEFI